MGCPNRIKTICAIPSGQGHALKRELERRCNTGESQREKIIKRQNFSKSKATISEREESNEGNKEEKNTSFVRRKRDLTHSPLDRPLPPSSYYERASERKTLVLSFRSSFLRSLLSKLGLGTRKKWGQIQNI